MIAEALGWEKERVDDLKFAALLHDIGKIGVPDYIINKTERLTDDEYMTIKSHPVIGAEVLHDMTEQLRQIIHSEPENLKPSLHL